jgi:hypothetical protein
MKSIRSVGWALFDNLRAKRAHPPEPPVDTARTLRQAQERAFAHPTVRAMQQAHDPSDREEGRMKIVRPLAFIPLVLAAARRLSAELNISI